MKTFSIIILFSIVKINSAYSIDNYKYTKASNDNLLCEKILNELSFSSLPISEKPLDVFVDFKIERISRINGENSSYEAAYTLWYYWRDIRLFEYLNSINIGTSEKEFLCDFAVESVWLPSRKLWNPDIEFFNVISEENLESYPDWIEIFSDGTVQARVKSIAEFQTDFYFENFPFDKQTFRFELWSEYPENIVNLIPDANSIDKYSSGFQSVYFADGWKQTGLKACQLKYDDDTDGFVYTGYVLEINADRSSEYFIQKVMIPLFLIILVCWTTFILPPSEVEAKLTVSSVAFLSLIAFNYAIDDELPNLSYLTIMDFIIIAAYTSAAISIVASAIQFKIFKNHNLNAALFSKLAVVICIISFPIITGITLYLFFNSEKLSISWC